MAKLRRRGISILARLRNYFITGIVVLIPIGITLYLTKFFISVSSKLIPYDLNPNNYLPFAIPGLEIVLAVIFITLVGGLFLQSTLLVNYDFFFKYQWHHCLGWIFFPVRESAHYKS